MINKICIMIVVVASVTFLSLNCRAASEYLVQDFSKEYYAKITPQEELGIIQIFKQGQSKRLIRVDVESDLSFYIDMDEETSVAYAEQQAFIFDDFNFDNLKDFAILNGRNSCYGGPSYSVYLAEGQSFKLSQSFSRLAQDYCGMFDYSAETKRLKTATKSGCCWHQFSTFVVENNQPKLIEIVEDSFNGVYLDTKTSRWNGTRMVQSTKKIIVHDGGPLKELMAFRLEGNNKKQVKLFLSEDHRWLNYAFINNENVEFNYPKVAGDDEPFELDQTSNEIVLIFYNGNTQYKVYQEMENQEIVTVGILVTIGNKVYDLKGDLLTLEGGLENFSDSIENLMGK